jgi:hypothetical protein
VRFSPESPIRDCDSIILNLRAYIRTRLQFWFSHFAENNPRPKRPTKKQQSTYAMELENRICKKAKVLGKPVMWAFLTRFQWFVAPNVRAERRQAKRLKRLSSVKRRRQK